VIAGAHVLIYSADADATRTFFRDVLGWKSVDAGDGWLIFALPPAELGVHPAGDEAPSGTHQLLLMCRDLEQTVADLKQRGAEFADEISDEGFGRLINLKVPGADVIGLYEPKHKSPLAEFG
jgi:catechol 2,3-dioxygenase-like lactoylglutathione lyase family enzyme